jgi:hypothetical protein
MAAKKGFRVFFDNGEQDGVVGDIKALEQLDEIFGVSIVEVVEIDGFDLEGICVLVFAGEHLDFAVAAEKQVVVVVRVIYGHVRPKRVFDMNVKKTDCNNYD